MINKMFIKSLCPPRFLQMVVQCRLAHVDSFVPGVRSELSITHACSTENPQLSELNEILRNVNTMIEAEQHPINN